MNVCIDYVGDFHHKSALKYAIFSKPGVTVTSLFAEFLSTSVFN